jgi:hypothetical protein
MYSHITYEKVPLITFGFIGMSTVLLASMIFRDTKQEAEPRQEQAPEPTQQLEERYEEQPYEETQGGKRKTKRNKAKHNRKTKRKQGATAPLRPPVI